MSKMKDIVQTMMQTNFKFDTDVKILVVTDFSTKHLGNAFHQALHELGWKSSIAVMKDRNKSGEEPDDIILEEMKENEIVFCITKHSLTHTKARKEANAKGISVITMPGITEDMFLNGAINANYEVVEKETLEMAEKKTKNNEEKKKSQKEENEKDRRLNKIPNIKEDMYLNGANNANYEEVEKETLEMAEKITEYNEVNIKTGENYSLNIPIGNREGIASTGVFTNEGDSGNLPSGEAYVAPLEYLANGEILINGSISGIGLLDEPVLIEIKDGKIETASGKNGEKLLEILNGGDGTSLAELGIGTNYSARVTGKILEDEKAYNTIHVAFGSNHTFGGTIDANVHIDCVTMEPEIEWLA